MRAIILAMLLAPAAAGQANLSIEGTVTQETTGAPIAGARVALWVNPMDTVVVLTDEAGHFRLNGLRNSIYSLAVGRTGFVPVHRSVNLSSAPSPGAMQISLAPQAVIAGRVVDQDGFPVGGSYIAVLRREANGTLQAAQRFNYATDDRGEFRLGGLSAGRYYVRASPGGMSWRETYAQTYYPSAVTDKEAVEIEVKAAEERAGIAIQLKKVTTVRISGRVMLPPGYVVPREGMIARVTLTKSSVDGASRTTGGQLERDGSFTIDNVSPGKYHIQPELPPPYGRGWTTGPANAEPNLEVGTADITGLVLKAEDTIPVDIAGMVVFDAGAKHVPTIIHLTQQHAVQAQTASLEDGSFTLRTVPPGKYQLSAAGADSAQLGGVELPYGDIEVKGPNPGKLVIRVVAAVGGVEGVVVDKAGLPMAGKFVVFRASKPGLHPAMPVKTDSEGRFKVKAVPKEYRVEVLDGMPVERSAPRGQVVTVVEGDNAALRIVAQ